MDNKTMEALLRLQKHELTQHQVYKNLAKLHKKHEAVLTQISEEKLKHHHFLKKYTQKNVRPNNIRILKYKILSRLVGLTFAIKLMQRKEKRTQKKYLELARNVPETKTLIVTHLKHEKKLMELIDDETLKYLGAIVLGLNDAVVETTGTIAGLSFALQETPIICITVLIAGISAALSLAASEYQEKKEENHKNPLKSAFYTGIMYLVTVGILLTPYLFITNYLIALLITVINALIVILAFTYFTSVIKEEPFKQKFFQMATISLGIATISFIIGIIVRTILGITI